MTDANIRILEMEQEDRFNKRMHRSALIAAYMLSLVIVLIVCAILWSRQHPDKNWTCKSVAELQPGQTISISCPPRAS